jgi:N-acetylneuraminic acid mutarotase
MDPLVDTYTIATHKWGPETYVFPASGSGATRGKDGNIYVLAGSDLSNSDNWSENAIRLNPRTGTWTPLPAMPVQLFGPAVTAGLAGRIYAIGGVTLDYSVVNWLEAYTPATRRWATLAPMPTARNALAAVTAPDGRIYAIGGATEWDLGPNANNLQPLSTVEIYNPRTNSWTAGPSLPESLYGMAAVLGPDDKIYVIGGDNDTDPGLDHVWTLDVRPPKPGGR